MPTQIFIIPPKQPRSHRPLSVSNSDKLPVDENSTLSVSTTPLHDPTLSSSDNKLSVIRAIPSVRISPPQPILDTLFDWDDEDQYSGRRSTFIRNRTRQQKQYQKRLEAIQEGIVHQTYPVVSAIVSAPIVEPPGGQSAANGTDHIASTTTSAAIKREGSPETGDPQGQTLLHLAAKLGHEDIIRLLISETSQANTLLNTRGQTPLLCAIEAGATSTATLLMEQDPLSLTCKDSIGSSAFHYATEQCNDIVLSRAISLLKRLSSSAARITVCTE